MSSGMIFFFYTAIFLPIHVILTDVLPMKWGGYYLPAMPIFPHTEACKATRAVWYIPPMYTHSHTNASASDNAARWPWDTELIGVCWRPMQFNLCCITNQSYMCINSYDHQCVSSAFRFSSHDFNRLQSHRLWIPICVSIAPSCLYVHVCIQVSVYVYVHSWVYVCVRVGVDKRFCGQPSLS